MTPVGKEITKPLINVDKEKCNNCHSCISACPIKVCLDGSGDVVEVIDRLCIGCGRCITACLQSARSYNDDTQQFFTDLQNGVDIITIVAPAAQAVFDDILRLNGYLKSIGVKAVFDVSFGAELTVKSYLNYVQKNKPPLVIAQPCPAIVSYCQIYKPELLKHLAPAHSPMLHTVAMIRHFFPQYKNCKIAAISPCAVKKREFVQTKMVDYNVTMLHLKEKISKEKIMLGSFSPVEYDGPPAERAVLFSSPGGLRETIARDAPYVVPKIRKIEGPDVVYKYLSELPEMLREGAAPFIVDCLNCEAGCNGGPGTGLAVEPIDRLEHKVERRSQKQIISNKKSFLGGRLKRDLKKYWKESIYIRTYKDYSNRSGEIKEPTEAQLAEVFKGMKKTSAEDMHNCSACGYGNCEMMAKMVFNGINKLENCHYYLKRIADEEEKLRSSAIDMANHLVFQIETSKETLTKLYDQVSGFIAETKEQGVVIDRSSCNAQNLIDQIHKTTRIAEEKRIGVESLGASTNTAKKDMQALLKAFAEVEQTTNEIAGIADVIEDVATSTNLLAMNAAIEAAHAGESGRGFAVVASEIRSLANTTTENANTISENIKNIIKQIKKSMELSNKTDTVMGQMIEGVDVAESSFSDIIQSQHGISDSTEELTSDLGLLNETSNKLRKSSTGILDALDAINKLIASLDDAADTAKTGGPGPSLGIF
ncbi:MAG: hypothetical protein Ta2F_06090 [Termitinemataceae bacterium]|nr:MAG: hypothetical protein Ta2F_06090 [Termitinemataceae bacterium]